MNIFDYIRWRGDLTLEHSPLTRVDSLIMANVVYNPLTAADWSREFYTFEELARVVDLRERTGNVYFEKWRELFYQMAEAPRYRRMRVCDYVDMHDDDLGIQFCAETIDCRNGVRYVAFRGTDSSIVGWEEDFRMAFDSPVPAQAAAVRYLTDAARSGDSLIVVGHSKGGCLAAYAAACVPKEVQDRIIKVYSFDGPGLSEKVMGSQGYARIQPRIESVIPQKSVVGLLMDYHTDYTVVHSTAQGIFQHDSFSWQLLGPDAYETEPEIEETSRAVSEGLHNWLASCTTEQRREFTEALFELLRATHAETLPEIRSEGMKTPMAMVNTYLRMDAENRKAFEQVSALLFGNVARSLMAQTTENVQEVIENIMESPVIEKIKETVEKPFGAVQQKMKAKTEGQEELPALPVIELPEPPAVKVSEPGQVSVPGGPTLVFGAPDEPVRKPENMIDFAKGMLERMMPKKPGE